MTRNKAIAIFAVLVVATIAYIGMSALGSMMDSYATHSQAQAQSMQQVLGK